MLYGIDVSHHNKLTTNNCENTDFAIFKATEGRSWTDPKFREYTDMFMAYAGHTHHPLIGCYHFARPQNGNTPQQEADHFLNVVESFVGKSILALDVEAGSERYPDWCCEWLSYVYDQTKVRPMLYISQSHVKNFKNCLEINCGLWVAHYKDGGNAYPKVKPGSISPWPAFAIWQWSNTKYYSYLDYPQVPSGFDANVFNGTVEAWEKYAIGDREPLPFECVNCTKECPRYRK